jgi:tetratricopeptide (TPR) repeat protein
MVGESYHAMGDWEGAQREYGQVSGRSGRDEYLEASVLLREGECLFNLGRYEDSIEKDKRLVDKHDDTFLLAEGLYQLGQTWDYDSEVEVLGFHDRTRTPVRLEIGGGAAGAAEGSDR